MSGMDIALMVALIAAVVTILWAGWTFNQLVRRRNGVDESRAIIDVELARRHDLVPALVEAVRGYMDLEAAVMTRVADARSRAVAAGAEGAAETSLTDALRSLFAVSEQYPELKASASFRELQDELALTEDRVAYARSLYNAWVTDYETSRQSFPTSMLASLLRFEPRPYFDADTASVQPVAVSLRDADAAS